MEASEGFFSVNEFLGRMVFPVTELVLPVLTDARCGSPC